MIERYHPNDQGQLQNISIVSRDHLHYLGSLKPGDCGTPELRKCVRKYNVLFGYYRRDLNFFSCSKKRLKNGGKAIVIVNSTLQSRLPCYCDIFRVEKMTVEKP